jgi:hypothetical protein
MKKVFFNGFIIFLLSLSFAGCEKTADDPGKLLVGKWDQQSTTIVRYYDNVKQNENTNTYNPGELVLEIYDDGTATKFLNGAIIDAFYWSIEGNLIVMTGNNGVVQKVEFTLDGTTLTLKWAVEDIYDGHISRSEYLSIYKLVQ